MPHVIHDQKHPTLEVLLSLLSYSGTDNKENKTCLMLPLTMIHSNCKKQDITSLQTKIKAVNYRD